MSKEKSFRTIEMDSESDEDDGETRCVCGSLSDKGLMVQCDKCEAWQHGVCVGFKEEDEVPDNWFCARCEAKLATARPSFSFVEEQLLITHLVDDYKALERAAGKQFPHRVNFGESQIGCHLLEKYALLFGRRKVPPACSEEAFFKALALLFGRTEGEIKEEFCAIANEVQASTIAALNANSADDDDGEMDPYDGWRKEVLNVYPKAGAKRPPACDDTRCPCNPFRRAEYPALSVHKCAHLPRGNYALHADEEILSGTLIIEFIGKVLKADQVKKAMRESTGSLFDHDIPFTCFQKKDGKEACIDARQRGNIARFVHHACVPNANLQVTMAHGRTYMGVYAKEDIAPGTPITVPFRFPGKNFRSTISCFCNNKETCPMIKWYHHRLNKIVPRLRVLDRPVKAPDEELISRFLYQKKKKRSALHSGGSKRSPHSSRDQVRNPSHSPSVESAKGKRRKRREEELAAVTRDLWADGEFPVRRKRRHQSGGEEVTSTPAVKQEGPLKVAVRSPSHSKSDTQDFPPKRRLIPLEEPLGARKKQKVEKEEPTPMDSVLSETSCSAAFLQLVKDIHSLEKAIAAPLESVSSLHIGKKRSILRFYDGVCRRHAPKQKVVKSKPVLPKKRVEFRALDGTKSLGTTPPSTHINHSVVPPPGSFKPAPTIPSPSKPPAVPAPPMPRTPPPASAQPDPMALVKTPPPSPPRLTAPVVVRSYDSPLSSAVPVGRFREEGPPGRPGRYSDENLPTPSASLYPPILPGQGHKYTPPPRKERPTVLGLPRSRNRWDDPGPDITDPLRVPRRSYDDRPRPHSGFSSPRNDMSPYRREDGDPNGEPHPPMPGHTSPHRDRDPPGGPPDHRRFDLSMPPRPSHMSNYPPYSERPSVSAYPISSSFAPSGRGLPFHTSPSRGNWGPPRGPVNDRRRGSYRGHR